MAIVKVQCDQYTWLNLKNPQKEEVSHLANEYKIHHLHLEDALNVKTGIYVDGQGNISRLDDKAIEGLVNVYVKNLSPFIRIRQINKEYIIKSPFP